MSTIKRLITTSSRAYPKVYRKFTALDLDNKTPTVYRIEDYPRDRFDEGVKFNMKHFFTHEPMSKTRNVINDATAVREFSQALLEMFKKNCSLVCFKENSDEIISANIMCVKSKEEYFEDYKVKKFLKFLN